MIREFIEYGSGIYPKLREFAAGKNMSRHKQYRKRMKAEKPDASNPASDRYRSTGTFSLGIMLLCLAFVGISATAAHAGQYTVEIAVDGQDEEEKNDAYRAALRYLLSRITSDNRVSNRDSVREGLRDAGRFVDKFNFRVPEPDEITQSALPVTPKVRQTGQASHILQIEFSQFALQDLLAGESESEEALPPPVMRDEKNALVWLLIEDDGPGILVGGGTAENVVARVRELAGGVGWILVFPQLDTLDMSLLGPAELIDQDEEKILQASSRYAQPNVMTGVISRNLQGQWEARFVKYSSQLTADLSAADTSDTEDSTSRVFEPVVGTLDGLLQSSVAWLAGEGNASGDEAALPTQGPGLSDTGALVWLGSVASAQEYSRAIKFFNRIESVDSVQPRDIRPDGILFSIQPREAIAAIQAAAEGRRWLQQGSRPPANLSQPSALATIANDPADSGANEGTGTIAGSESDTTIGDVLGADVYLEFVR